MRNLIIVFLCFFACVSTASADQRQDLHRVMQELDFMIDTVKNLQQKNQNDASHIRFHYEGLLLQLTTTRDRIALHLNNDLTELKLLPSTNINQTLTK